MTTAQAESRNDAPGMTVNRLYGWALKPWASQRRRFDRTMFHRGW